MRFRFVVSDDVTVVYDQEGTTVFQAYNKLVTDGQGREQGVAFVGGDDEQANVERVSASAAHIDLESVAARGRASP